jgi:hypothetical protein
MLELASLSYRFQCVAKIGTIGVNIWWFLLFISFSPSKGSKMNYPAAELRGIRCHAGLDKPAPAICKPGGIQFRFLDPVFRRDDDLPQADGVLKK